MLKIRLMRIGTKKKPFYRVVVVDGRAKRTGSYVELLGTYNPLTEPKDVKINKERIDHWIKQGAQPSVGYLRMIGKAPQRPPRKPKKEQKKEEPVAAPAPETPIVEEKSASEEAAKSSEPEATGAVESDASATDEPTPETKPKDKKDEGSA